MSEQSGCLGLGLTDESIGLVEQRQRLLGYVAAGGSLGSEARDKLDGVNRQLHERGLLAHVLESGGHWVETDLYLAALGELFCREMAGGAGTQP